MFSLHLHIQRLAGLALVLVAAAVLSSPTAHALSANAAHTVTIEQLQSDGTVSSGGDSLGLSTSATTDVNGKLSFSFAAGVPDNTSCNFLVITITDANGDVARKSLVPCPDPGDNLPLGVSEVTDKQADAMLDAFQASGTDDPIMAVFGFVSVRQPAMTASDLSTIASLATSGISGNSGFVAHLTNTRSVTSAQLQDYRNAIVSRLADPTSGYSKLMKDSVDDATTNSTAEAAKRGEAAAKLLQVLVDAANDAGFSPDWIMEAFNAMGAVVVPAMQTAVNDGDLSQTAFQAVNAAVGGGIQKLRADRQIDKYTNALADLGAGGSDLDTYESAANNLASSMRSAFAEFEKVFDGTETQSEIQSAQQTLNTKLNQAFSTFATDVGVSDSRISNMITKIETALASAGHNVTLNSSEFEYYPQGGGQAVNWPVTRVIPAEFVADIISSGGQMTYTRDTTTIPDTMTWVGTCSDPSYFDKSTCESNGGTWTKQRTDFSSFPTSYASLHGLREDMEILEFKRWDDMSGGQNSPPSQQQMMQAEQNFTNNVQNLISNLGGTTDGSTSLSQAEKEALVQLMQSPQF